MGVKETYGGSVPITTIHATGKPTDYFHSSMHAHLLHADNINKFSDKGTVIDTYDISRDELMAQGRLIIKDPIDVKPTQKAITTMSYGAPQAVTTMSAPITTMAAPITTVAYGAPMAPMTITGMTYGAQFAPAP